MFDILKSKGLEVFEVFKGLCFEISDVFVYLHNIPFDIKVIIASSVLVIVYALGKVRDYKNSRKYAHLSEDEQYELLKYRILKYSEQSEQ